VPLPGYRGKVLNIYIINIYILKKVHTKGSIITGKKLLKSLHED
jgi:hypothetical protein